MKIVVCGGGISGLAFALAVSGKPDVSVDIYESAAEFRAVGAGIGIWMRVWELLDKLGVGEALRSKTTSTITREPVAALRFRKSDGPEGREFYQLVSSGPFVTFHRHDLQNTLINHLPGSCKMHCSKRLTSYRTLPNARVEVTFADGSQVTCDLLIGADGIKSAVRGNLMRELARKHAATGDHEAAHKAMMSSRPVWSGTMAYRSLIPMVKAQQYLDSGTVSLQECHVMHLGKNAHLIVYPVRNGSMINFAGFYHEPSKAGALFEGPWVSQGSKEDLRSIFSNYEPIVQNWVKLTDESSRWAIHTIEDLETYVADGVALIGDAAHAMMPFQGAGAGQGIEDAIFLANLLNTPSVTTHEIPHVLAVYDAVRRPFDQEAARLSRISGSYFMFSHPDFCDRVYDENASGAQQEEILRQMGEALDKNWEWVWTTSFDECMEAGIRMLEEMMKPSETDHGGNSDP